MATSIRSRTISIGASNTDDVRSDMTLTAAGPFAAVRTLDA
jgi:hypothetical protein